MFRKGNQSAMAVIDAEGLFAGNRMGLLTDEARLHFPWLLVASNGFGRLEINHNGIIARVYQAFRLKPTQVELLGWVQEYHSAGLLFLYECAGQYWGQWDTRPELLPRFKTARDRRSPAPPEPDFSDWKRSYREQNTAVPKSITNVSEVLRKDFGNVAEGFPCGGGIGIGVGTGIGDGKNTCASPDGNARSSVGHLPIIDEPKLGNEPDTLFPTNSRKPAKAVDGLTPQQETWWADFWNAYWLKRSRKAARQAFAKQVRSLTRFQEVMGAVQAQSPEMLARQSQHRPQAATWLRGERWADDVPTAEETRHGSGDLIDAAMRLLEGDTK